MLTDQICKDATVLALRNVLLKSQGNECDKNPVPDFRF
jgi:hypothetical protein